MKSFSDWPKSHLLTCLVYLWYTNDRIIGKKEEWGINCSIQFAAETETNTKLHLEVKNRDFHAAVEK